MDTDLFLSLDDHIRCEVLAFEAALDAWRLSRHFLISQLEACSVDQGDANKAVDWAMWEASSDLLRETHDVEADLLMIAFL